jgi:signal peptidase I
MERDRLVLVVFFVVFAVQNVFLVGYFRFCVKGYEVVTVRGTSMFPTLKNGEKAVICCNIVEGNLTGRIVVFGDVRICHRCVRDEGEWLTFKGDNSSVFERATRDELKAVFVKVTQDPFLDSLMLGLQ